MEVYLMVTSTPPISFLPVHLFKDSYEPFLMLLKEHGVEYNETTPAPGVIMASGNVVGIIQSLTPWAAALAAVICAFLKNKRSRKVIITTKDGNSIHCEGLSEADIEKVLFHTQWLAAIETNKDKT